MRLRQLATTQSIVFLAPPEVHQSILDLRNKTSTDSIDSHDVICWLLEQTCVGIEQVQPLYYSQGADFCRRTAAASNNPEFLVKPDQREKYLASLRQIEQQTLEQLYDPKASRKPEMPIGNLRPKISNFMKNLNNLRKGFQDTDNDVYSLALQEVEQEREVAFEVETVREVQKPVRFSALQFGGLHGDIMTFAMTGRLAVGSTGYEHVFVALRRTALGLKYKITSEAISSNLYVTTEFTKTVNVLVPSSRPDDNFQVSYPFQQTLFNFYSLYSRKFRRLTLLA